MIVRLTNRKQLQRGRENKIPHQSPTRTGESSKSRELQTDEAERDRAITKTDFPVTLQSLNFAPETDLAEQHPLERERGENF